jgi:hypothetical protein
MYYYFAQPQPPYFLLFAGFLIALTSGLAFQKNLSLMVDAIGRKDNTVSQNLFIGFPFYGICLGVIIFLASGLEIFLGSRSVSYGLSIVLTTLTAGLVWTQLQGLLKQVREEGIASLDLDNIF